MSQKLITEEDQKYMLKAFEVSKFSNCVKGNVGAVIVKNSEILGEGNNSVPIGCEPCTKENCIRKVLQIKSGQRQELCKGVHAEQNAILNALLQKKDIKGSTIYVTKSPCMICSKLLINVGVKRVFYASKYPDEESFKILKEVGVETIYFELLGEQ